MKFEPILIIVLINLLYVYPYVLNSCKFQRDFLIINHKYKNNQIRKMPIYSINDFSHFNQHIGKIRGFKLSKETFEQKINHSFTKMIDFMLKILKIIRKTIKKGNSIIKNQSKKISSIFISKISKRHHKDIQSNNVKHIETELDKGRRYAELKLKEVFT